MARGARKKKNRDTFLPDAVEAVQKLKFEIASELGENPKYYAEYWTNINTRELAQPNGQLMREMIAKAEADLRAREAGFK